MTGLALLLPECSSTFTSNSTCDVVVMETDTLLNLLNLLVNLVFGLASSAAAMLSIRAIYETREDQTLINHGEI